MKLKIKLLILAALLVLVIPVVAGAAPLGTWSSELNPAGQTFWGDGAVFSGGYLAPPAQTVSGSGKCLECHGGSGPIPDKSSYLKTGHANMLVKTTPGHAFRGANTLRYPTDSVGHVINWTTGKLNLGGWCSVSGFEGQFTQSGCVAQSGVWTPGTRLVNLIYTIGGWMSVDAPDVGIMGGDLPANTFYMGDGRTYGTCGGCHNTGYKAFDYARPQPWADYPTLNAGAAAGIGGSWVLDGIQCERCHDATLHQTSPYYPVTIPRGASSTALCSQCHIRPAAWEGSANPNAATQPTAYPIGASATNFGSHLIGKQFLNSPHAKFTGAYGQIATTTGGLYGSAYFLDGICTTPGDYLDSASCTAAGGLWISFQGGCTTCHDVHQSTVPEAQVNFGAEPMKRECNDCHKGPYAKDLTKINHPWGTGTPMENALTDPAEACEICHMPKPAGGAGLSVHVFRISTDPAYATFPVEGATTPGICSDPTYTTMEACIAQNKSWSLVANSAPDGPYTNAVWVDLELACGQCHASQFTKAQMAQAAKTMHSSDVSSTDCTVCHTMTAPHHVVGSIPCLTCHTAVPLHSGVLPSPDCAGCHTAIIQSGPYRNHHAGSCKTCHQGQTDGVMPGVNYAITIGTSGSALGKRVIDQTIIGSTAGGCLICHSTTQTRSADGNTIKAIVPTTDYGKDNHHRGHAYMPGQVGTDPGLYCLGCHGSVADNDTTYKITSSGLPTALVSVQKGMLPAAHQAPTPADVTSILCVQCHSETDTGNGNFIQSGPNKNHHSGACLSCHKADGSSTNGTYGAGVGTITGGKVVCTICHKQRISETAMRHPYNPPGTPSTCEECHTVSGVLPIPTDGCLVCHIQVPAYSFFLHVGSTNQKPTGCTLGFQIRVRPVGSRTVQFTDKSTDLDGNAFVYVNWGDGQSQRNPLGSFFKHTYANPGTYTITKTVKDSFGASCIAKRKVTLL